MIQFNVQKKLDAPGGEMLLDLQGEFPQGQLITIFGESGAGKTSLLRIFAGLLMPETGKIIVNQQTWFDNRKGINLSPQKRKIGFVFQDYALFPNMTVQKNIEFAAKNRQNKKEITDLFDLFNLGELLNKKPETLSGGQKQRVALARAIASKPEILMLDEPLSALDHVMRSKLQDYILTVHKKYNLTTFLVSHDVGEIFKMADKVIVLDNGKITNQGTPSEVFSNKHISGKFQFTGEIIRIEKEDVIYVVTVLIGNSMVKVVSEEKEIHQFSIGDKVLVASKAFNPIIQKIQSK